MISHSTQFPDRPVSRRRFGLTAAAAIAMALTGGGQAFAHQCIDRGNQCCHPIGQRFVHAQKLSHRYDKTARLICE